MKFSVATLFATLASCQGQNLVQVLEEQGQETAVSLIELAGLRETLETGGPFTLFVPSQDVFDSLPPELVEAITSDPEALAQVLLYHTVVGEAPSSALANELVLETAQGAGLRVNLYDVGGNTVATVAGVPIELENVDNAADNGLIHYLQYVILNIPVGDSVDSLALVEGATFEALVAAVVGTDLLATIQGATDVSVLAPIDSDAFNTAVVDELLADPEALSAILLNHVAEGTLFSAGIGAGTEISTVGGATLSVVFTDDMGYVIQDADGNLLADVIAGDIPTSQGVLHIIDRPIIV